MKKFLFGLLAGISAGILFAPESGKKLRTRLKKSDAKFADFGEALLKAGKDASGEVKDLIESKEMQELLKSGKENADRFLTYAEEKGKDLSISAQKEFSALTEKALDHAEKAKNTVTKKAKTVKKTVEKKLKG